MKKIKVSLPKTNLVTIGTLTDAIDAELVKNTLLDHDIPCQLDGDNQGGFPGMFEIGVMVRDTDAENAGKVAEIHFPHLFGST